MYSCTFFFKTDVPKTSPNVKTSDKCLISYITQFVSLTGALPHLLLSVQLCVIHDFYTGQNFLDTTRVKSETHTHVHAYIDAPPLFSLVSLGSSLVKFWLILDRTVCTRDSFQVPVVKISILNIQGTWDVIHTSSVPILVLKIDVIARTKELLHDVRTEDYTRPSQDLSWYVTHHHDSPWDSLTPFPSCTEFRGKNLWKKKNLFHNLTPGSLSFRYHKYISLRSSLCHLFIITEKTRVRAWEEMRWLWQWYGLFPPKTQSLHPSYTPPENIPFK